MEPPNIKTQYSANDFCVHFAQNSQNIMWFLGAGASRSARIITAWDIICELKCQLYCLKEGNDLSHYKDYTSPVVRAEVQNYFSSQEGFPAEGSIEEYSFYFEQRFKGNKEAQRKYIESIVKHADVTSSYGLKFLALLLKERHANIAWTTNFDSVIEDAFSKVDGNPSDLRVAHLEGASLALQAINDRNFPLYVKLHGDFRYDALKNTTDELKSQNQDFSKALETACNQFGLAIVGYSGRDESVMDAFNKALEGSNPFPQGLFWFSRFGTKPLASVETLIKKAREKGVNAQLVEVGTFDELMIKLKKQFTKISPELARQYLDRRFEPPKIELPSRGTNYPLIKTNAISILNFPRNCYTSEQGKIKNQKELNSFCKESNSEITAVLREGKILSLAQEQTVKTLLGANTQPLLLTEDLTASPQDYIVQSLLRDALGKGFCVDSPLRISFKNRNLFIRPDCEQTSNQTFSNLKKAIGNTLYGRVPNTGIDWYEAVQIKIDHKLSQLWLLLTPDIYLATGNPHRENFDAEMETAREFKKNRTKMRRNYDVARLLNIWMNILIPSNGKIPLFSDGESDVCFELERHFASSGRQ
jgi:hypothetical protein